MEKLLTVVAESEAVEKRLVQSIRDVLGDDEHELHILLSHQVKESSDLLFIDTHAPDLKSIISVALHDKKTVILIVYEDDQKKNNAFEWSSEFGQLVHDVVVFPFRKTELISKVRLHAYFKLWSEVGALNESFSGLLGRLGEDLELATRLQKAALPSRFPPLRGFKAESRYFAGLRSGGDHFDLAESKDGSRISLILSDSSSYGLSSALLSTLMRVAVKLSADEVRSCEQTIQLIYSDLLLALKEKDLLSLFYGVISRKDYSFQFIHLGYSSFYRARPGQKFELVPVTGEAIRRHGFEPLKLSETTIKLDPKDRLVFLTDGYIEACGGSDAALHLLNEHREHEMKDLLNAFAFQVKKHFKEDDDLPEQDCTAIVLDVDANLLRLA
jgi:hypothetical protein